jgi:AcrR family transcriptional regulator
MSIPASGHSARRDELVEKAYAYVRERGIATLSLRPLASAIDSSPRVLLYLFGSKEGLVRALLERARLEEMELLDRVRATRGEADLATVAAALWRWLAARRHRGVLSLWVESYARSLVEPTGPWGEFAERTVADWLELLAAAQPPRRRRSAHGGAERTFVLAILRGALLDLLASGDQRRTTAAVKYALDALLRAGERVSDAHAGTTSPPRFHSAEMPDFKLRFPASEIDALARRFGYADDAPLLAAGAAARARGHYTREEFIAVCGWKTARSRSKVASNTETAVLQATRRALGTTDETMRMNALLQLAGVGVPTASVLLYFAFPDDYPILDVRALDSLGVKPRSQYPLSFWLEYLCTCRELARRHRVSIRTLDKALWQHSKECTGTQLRAS